MGTQILRLGDLLRSHRVPWGLIVQVSTSVYVRCALTVPETVGCSRRTCSLERGPLTCASDLNSGSEPGNRSSPLLPLAETGPCGRPSPGCSLVPPASSTPRSHSSHTPTYFFPFFFLGNLPASSSILLEPEMAKCASPLSLQVFIVLLGAEKTLAMPPEQGSSSHDGRCW